MCHKFFLINSTRWHITSFKRPLDVPQIRTNLLFPFHHQHLGLFPIFFKYTDNKTHHGHNLYDKPEMFLTFQTYFNMGTTRHLSQAWTTRICDTNIGCPTTISYETTIEFTHLLTRPNKCFPSEFFDNISTPQYLQT